MSPLFLNTKTGEIELHMADQERERARHEDLLHMVGNLSEATLIAEDNFSEGWYDNMLIVSAARDLLLAHAQRFEPQA